MSTFDLPKSNTDPLPKGEFISTAASGNIEHEAFPVKKPVEDLDDFKVQVRASTLRRVRSKLQGIEDPDFPWHELTLGISTLAFGGSLGALPAKLAACDALAILFYTVLPVIGTGCLVAYLFLRHGRSVHQNPVRSVDEALAELPDPENTR